MNMSPSYNDTGTCSKGYSNARCSTLPDTTFLSHSHIILYHLSVKPPQRLHMSAITISFCFATTRTRGGHLYPLGPLCFDNRYDPSFRPPVALTFSPRALKAFCNSEVISLLSFNTPASSRRCLNNPVPPTTFPLLPRGTRLDARGNRYTANLSTILGENVNSSPKVTVGRTGCGRCRRGPRRRGTKRGKERGSGIILSKWESHIGMMVGSVSASISIRPLFRMWGELSNASGQNATLDRA